jgi:cytosine/adenosine deaminase-related metal-dependent hydrolase
VLVVGEGAVGQSPDLGCAAGGAKALYRASGAIEPGLWADLMAIDLDHPTWCALPPEHILDGLIFAAPSHVVTDVWSAGRHQVKQGRHIHRTQIVQDWRRAVNTLVSNV